MYSKHHPTEDFRLKTTLAVNTEQLKQFEKDLWSAADNSYARAENAINAEVVKLTSTSEQDVARSKGFFAEHLQGKA